MEAKTLTEQFIRASDLMRRAHRKHRMERRTEGPHRGQGRILVLLRSRPEISQRELAYILDMRAQSLGEILAKLEANGYIVRTPSIEDRRAIDIKLTEAGAEAAKELEAARQQSDRVFDSLTADEQDVLGALLDKLIVALESELGSGDEDVCLGAGMHNFGDQMQGFGRRIKKIIKHNIRKSFDVDADTDDEDDSEISVDLGDEDDNQRKTKIVTIVLDKNGNKHKRIQIIKHDQDDEDIQIINDDEPTDEDAE